MHSKKLLPCSLLALMVSIAHAKVPDNLLTGWNNINASQLQHDVAYLASDQLQGRLPLNSGNEKAMQWIVAEFKQAGLAPAANGSYLQEVKLIQYRPDQKQTYVEFKEGNHTQHWKKPSVSTEYNHDLDVSANVVFAGFGISAPALHYDDYENIDVRGKIVLVFEHEPQETNPASIFNGTGNTIYATTRIKALNAQQHGAVAILIAPEPNRKHLSNAERFARIGDPSTSANPPSLVLADNELHIPVAIVTDHVANEITKKHFALGALQSAIDKNLRPQSRIIPNVRISLHERVISRRTGTSYNVVGLLKGSDPLLKNETVILSAHHDHDGIEGKKIWHGADDNASGTAGVVALARAMALNAKNGVKPKRSILFVVFAAEEEGLLGSFYMTAHPLRPLATTRAMINFDMIGRNETRSLQTDGMITIPGDTTNRLNLIGSHYSPEFQQTVIDNNKHVGLVLDNRFDSETALNVFFRSDQFPFVLKNIPAFWFFTGFHPDYHHPTDTADKINYEKMKKILQLAYLSAYDFANKNVPPAFVANPKL